MSQSVPSKPLGKICKEIYRYPTYYGITYVEEGIPEVRGELILDNGEIEADQTQWRFIDKVTAAKFPRTALEVNDLVMSVRGTIGKIGLIPTSLHGANITANLIRISPYREVVEPRFLWHFMRTKRFQMDLNHVSPSTTIKTIRAPDLKAIPIPLPPLEEQRRIAAILDKADAVRRKRQEAIALTEELLRSAFLEMFGDPGKNPHQWTTACIGDIAEIVTDGTHQTPTRSESGVMLLSARNIKNGYIDISEDVDFVPQVEYERLRKSYDPKRQDVLISCSGSVGRVTVVRDFGPFSMVRSVAVVRPKLKFINSEFLESLLHSAYLRASMVKGSKQSSQANLFQGAIKELPTILPPLCLQEQWQTFKLRVRETAKRYSQMQDSQTELFNSLLQRAFRGEL